MSPFDSEFALQQDSWNDFSFQTLYHLYRRQTDSQKTPSLIGSVKILKRGQTESDGIQIKQDFSRLDANFCSVGSSLDYYCRLSELPSHERTKLLSALRDVASKPSLQLEFGGEPGWTISLFRNNPDITGYLQDAAAILARNFSALADIDQPIRFLPTNWSTPLELNFSAPRPISYFLTKQESSLPARINVVIGRNGSGKSTLLSRIARVAFASPADRSLPEVQNIGAFDPKSVGFIKIIAISYSPFDNFIVPGVRESDRRQIAQDIESGTGRYIYAGIRDIVAEARESIDELNQHNEGKQLTTDERRSITRLKSIDQLADEFERLINQIANNRDNELWNIALKALLADTSFADIQSTEPSELFGSNVRSAFHVWSTGHKIALHVIASLVAHTERRSLVLFDEPEMHLHPPLIAALMRSFRIVLEKKNALAVVATHSPVVLQETLARHVHIIRRTGSDFRVFKPLRETFGENVGILTYDAFGLTAHTTDFHRVLDELVNSCDTIEEINELFENRLSGQALSYVMASLVRKAKQ